MPMFPLSDAQVQDIMEALHCQAAALYSDSQGEADWRKADRLEALAQRISDNAKAQFGPFQGVVARAEAMR